MTQPFETHVDAEEVAASAADLALRAEELRASLSGPVERIRELNAQEPWGNDGPGDAFCDSYLGTSSEDGDAVESVLTGCQDLCDQVSGLAEDTGVGALTTQLVDESSGEEIPRLLAQFEEGRAGLAAAGGELGAVVHGWHTTTVGPAAPETTGQPPVGPARLVRGESPQWIGRAGPADSGTSFPRRAWSYQVGAAHGVLRPDDQIRSRLAARWIARSVPVSDPAEADAEPDRSYVARAVPHDPEVAAGSPGAESDPSYLAHAVSHEPDLAADPPGSPETAPTRLPSDVAAQPILDPDQARLEGADDPQQSEAGLTPRTMAALGRLVGRRTAAGGSATEHAVTE